MTYVRYGQKATTNKGCENNDGSWTTLQKDGQIRRWAVRQDGTPKCFRGLSH